MVEENTNERTPDYKGFITAIYGEQYANKADDPAIQEELVSTFGSMTYMERETLKLKYGLEGYDYTLGEIARIFKTTQKKIEGIESRALGKLDHGGGLRALIEQ